MEILADCISDGADESLLEAVKGSNTTEEAVGHLSETGNLELVMSEVTGRIQRQLESWSHGKVCIQVVTFSTVYGILGKSQGADALIRKLAMEDL